MENNKLINYPPKPKAKATNLKRQRINALTKGLK